MKTFGHLYFSSVFVVVVVVVVVDNDIFGTATGLTPGGSSTVHIYTQTTQNSTINNFG
jgi:hypothetical protein